MKKFHLYWSRQCFSGMPQRKWENLINHPGNDLYYKKYNVFYNYSHTFTAINSGFQLFISTERLTVVEPKMSKLLLLFWRWKAGRNSTFRIWKHTNFILKTHKNGPQWDPLPSVYCQPYTYKTWSQSSVAS